MKFTWPGHNWLGPGNSLTSAPPVDNADKIAQQHDFEYHFSQNQSDIFDSDKRAIAAFSEDFVEHPNLPSLAGSVGLKIKTGFEHLIGHPIYPSGNV